MCFSRLLCYAVIPRQQIGRKSAARPLHSEAPVFIGTLRGVGAGGVGGLNAHIKDLNKAY